MNTNGILTYVEKINNLINGYVWGTPMLGLILVTGIVMTVGTRFFQITRLGHWLRETAGSIFTQKSVTAHTSKDDKQISQFQAFCTALAATIGTGNIAGVATAIAIGGPGAVFWMWVSAFFGMMTSFAENVLGIYYRYKNADGEWCGGVMYYLEEGLGAKKGCKIPAKVLAVMFSVFCICASFGIGNMTQANSISSALNANFGIPQLQTGIALSVAVALVIVGGAKRIGSVAEKLVPLMSFFYIGTALSIFFANYDRIGYVFSSIIQNAFGFAPVAGAGGGLMIQKAVNFGFKRGVFSNEAGLGSAVTVNAASNVKDPVRQGMWGIFGVFFDTIVVCTLTAFVLLSSTCSAIPLEEALSNITKEPQYVAICNPVDYSHGVPLMDISANPIIEPAPEGDLYTVTPEVGTPFKISLKKADSDDESKHIYTNIMTVRGISIDKHGKTDNSPKAPINAVVIEQLDGVPLVTHAFSTVFGSWAGKLLAVAVLFFAFSTLIGWSFYGVKAWEYLFGKRSTALYKMIFVIFPIIGATVSLGLVWSISDTLNGLMALPNLIGLLALSGTVFAVTKRYKKDKL